MDGGVLIGHQLHEGKHQYEVKGVVKHKRQPGEKMFIRGDKLKQVNGADIQDLTPEELAQTLAEGNPKLTVHKAIKKKEPIDPPSLDEDILYPYAKEETLLQFSMEMKRETDEPLPDEEEDICTEENEESSFLVVTMEKTSVSVIIGRGCDTQRPCHECHTVTCEYSDIVMVTESSTVTLIPRGSGSFRQLKHNEALVEHVTTNLFIKSLCSQKQVYVSQSPERFTIYYYKSETVTQGLPVVMKFTGSDCFLKCCKEGDRVRLQVEMCEKQKLEKISKSDPCTLAYVFYMKSERTRNTTFESALHTGWFIQIVSDTEKVEMVKTDGPREDKFFHIIIQSQKA